MIREPEFVSREQLEDSYLLRNSGALARRSNSAIRATEVDFRRFLRELDEASGGNNLQYILKCPCIPVTNFIQPYLHQFFIDSHSLNGYGKPLKRPFNRY